MTERTEKCPTCGTWTMRFDPALELEVEEEATALIELNQRVEHAEAQVARIRAFLEDMATWCSPRGITADYSRRGLDALDGVDPLGAGESVAVQDMHGLLPTRVGKTAQMRQLADEAVAAGGHVHIVGRSGQQCVSGDCERSSSTEPPAPSS